MTDFTFANENIKIQEDRNSSRSINPLYIYEEKFSISKISKNNTLESEKDESNNNNINSLNNSVLKIENNSPENKNKNSLQNIIEIKDITINTTNFNDVKTTISNLRTKKKESRFGNTFPFLFYMGEPLIVIGPFCNFI